MNLEHVAERIVGKNWSRADLALAIVIFLYMLFPNTFAGFLDLPGLFIPGFIFFVLFIFRGAGLLFLSFFWFLFVWRIVKSMKLWYLDGLLEYFSRMLIEFFVSYIDATVIGLILTLFSLPIISVFLDIGQIEYTLNEHAYKVFSTLPSFLKINDGMIYIYGMLLTGFSYLNLYLIKQFNFAIFAGEDLKKVIRREMTVSELNDPKE